MAIPFLNHLDLRSVSELQNAILHTTTHTAATNKPGAIIYDTGSDTIKYCTGTSNSDWISLGAEENTTYDLSVEQTGGNNDNPTIRLTGSDSTTDNLTITGGTNITVTRNSGTELTIDAGAATTVGLTNGSQRSGSIELIAGTNVAISESGTTGHYTFSSTDTNTQLTQEQVEDFVDGLLTAGEGIDLTYDDTNGTLTVDAEKASATNLGVSKFNTNNFSVSVAGDVQIKDGGVANAELVNDSITINGSAVALGGSVTTPNDDVDVSKANLKTRLASMDSTDTVYIGDADDDTTVIIRGTLQVDGTTTTVNSETLTVDDNKIVLNDNQSGTPTEDAGLEIERGSGTNVELRWNESDDDWEFQAYNHAGTPALTTYKIPTTYKTTIGDGSATAIAISHMLGSRDVIVQLYDSSSYETVNADVVRTDTERVTITFASAPANNDVTVLVSKVG